MIDILTDLGIDCPAGRDVGFFRLSVRNSGNRHDQKKTVPAAKAKR